MNELGFTDEQLRGMTPAQIIELRRLMAGNLSAQNRLAPIDHRMFTRDAAATEGPLAALAIAGASPFYQLSKMQYGPHSAEMGDSQTSPPSWAQFLEGYKGLGEGLMDWSKSKVKTKVRNPLGDGATSAQQEFLDKLRSLPPEMQREFLSQQMSYGVPDSSVQYPRAAEPEGQSAVMDMVREQRAKARNLLSQPL